MQIVITVDENNKLSFSTSKHIPQSKLTDILCTAQLLSMNSVIQMAEHDPRVNIKELKEYLFDQYNTSASNVLDEFLPNHMRADLTEKAILKMENSILKKTAKVPDPNA